MELALKIVKTLRLTHVLLLLVALTLTRAAEDEKVDAPDEGATPTPSVTDRPRDESAPGRTDVYPRMATGGGYESGNNSKNMVAGGTTATCSSSGDMMSSKRVYCSYIERYDIDYFRSHLKDASSSMSLEIRRSVMDDFPPTVFEGHNISSLTVHDSVLSHFPGDSFLSLKAQLYFLDLSYNNIEVLVPSNLANLQFKSNLQALNLSSNRLQSLPTDAFRWFPELKTLILSQNLLSTIARHTFTSGLVNLRNLDMQQNLIANLDEEAFYSVFSLEVVDLSHNAISIIRRNSFHGLHHLSVLNMDWNALANLEKDTFTAESFPQLNMLSIEGNRFNCSCDLAWFKAFLKTNGIPSLGFATCLYPRFALFDDVNFCQ